MRLKQYSLVIIKPDAMEQFLDSVAVNGLQKRGLSIVLRKFTRLSREQAEELYSEKRGYNYYLRLIDFMTEGPSLLLFTKSVKKGVNAAERAKEYRDWARKNLKILKFEVKPEDLELLNKGVHPEQEEITREMALRNLIHVPDNTESALKTVCGTLTQWELTQLKEVDSELHQSLCVMRQKENKIVLLSCERIK